MDRTTLLLSLARFAAAVARLCLGPLLPILTISLGFDEASKPTLLSAYSSGYILTQIGGGYIADGHGFSKVIAASVGISALVLLYVSTLASTVDQWTNAFFVMGLVAGPLFPAGSSAISTNVPPSQRAASAALVDAAASAGTCVASLTPLIASHLGWRSIYYVTSCGLAMVAVMTPNMLSSTTASRYKKKTSQSNSPPPSPNNSKETNTTASKVLIQPSAVLTYVCHSVDNFSKYTINAYAATLLFAKFDATAARIGMILGLQEAVAVGSKILVGTLSLKWRPTLFNRGRASAVGFFFQGLALCMAVQASTELGAALGFTLSALWSGLHSSGYRALYMEIAPDYSGAMSGVGNTIASVASVLGPITIGAAMARSNNVPDEQTWTTVGLWMLSVNVMGSVAAATVAVQGDPILRRRHKVLSA